MAAETTNNYDMSNVPLLVVGMPEQFVTNPSYSASAAGIQSALTDTPNRKTFSAFVDVSAFTNAEPLHHSAETQRWIGSTGLPQAYIDALKNDTAVPSTVALLSGNVQSETALAGDLILEGDVDIPPSRKHSLRCEHYRKT